MNFSYYNVIYDNVHSSIILALGSFKLEADAQVYLDRQVHRVLSSNAAKPAIDEALRAIYDAVIDYNKMSGRNLIV